MMTKVFGAKKEEAMGDWREMHNEELNNVFSSPDVTMDTPWRTQYAGHAANGRRNKIHTGVWREILKETSYLREIGIDGRLILL
jgi:hypothetical protein